MENLKILHSNIPNLISIFQLDGVINFIDFVEKLKLHNIYELLCNKHCISSIGERHIKYDYEYISFLYLYNLIMYMKEINPEFSSFCKNFLAIGTLTRFDSTNKIFKEYQYHSVDILLSNEYIISICATFNSNYSLKINNCIDFYVTLSRLEQSKEGRFCEYYVFLDISKKIIVLPEYFRVDDLNFFNDLYIIIKKLYELFLNKKII
jgi:hypothetical protein